MCRVRFLGLSRAVNIWSKNWDPKAGQLLFQWIWWPITRANQSPQFMKKFALHLSIRTSVFDFFVNNELHDKSRQWINVKLKNDPMAGEGKKREKFHTHRAGKLDQENLYTGAAHLYPPLIRSYPPSLSFQNAEKNFFEWWACTGKIRGRLGSWPPH